MDRLWGRGEDGDAKVAKAYDLRDEYKTIKTQYDAFLGKFTLLVQSVKARAKKGKENDCTQVKGARLAGMPHRHALGWDADTGVVVWAMQAKAAMLVDAKAVADTVLEVTRPRARDR
jgi:hypothetical protein